MKKISVISGGSGGLGLAVALHLVKAGKNVLLLGRDSEKLTKAARKLSRIAGESHVSTMVCNIGDEGDVKRTAAFLKEHRIVPEYLINNAGRGLATDLSDTTSELIDSVFEANIKGMMLLTTRILSITPESEELTIVNIMSTSALVGRSCETVYCAAKWAARGYTEALRAELAGKKRNVIAVYPGGMKTDFYKVFDKERDISAFMNPDEVAKRIVDAILGSDRLLVSDITINRKK